MNTRLFRSLLLLLPLALLFSCKNTVQEKLPVVLWEGYDETSEIAEQQKHEMDRMKYKLIQSKFLDKNEVFQKLYSEVANFSEERYQTLKPLILEKDIITLQKQIQNKVFTYEELTLFYLKRIYKYELNPETSLHTIIALNPTIVKEARERDKHRSQNNHPIYGMPILLKDNISTTNMKTTAGAFVLKDNLPKKEAFIVGQLKKNGALILGKVNLSEWAYYFCSGCPVGYSAIGGQTLNPYARKVFESGGSSSGSGTSIAANYAVAAVGTETAGSILSPASQNSLVGLKPTVGILSRSGIVPISHSLDTPGPMTKNIIDNAILLDAMLGKDVADESSISWKLDYKTVANNSFLKGKRLGVIKGLLNDSIYSETIKKLEANGAILIEFDPPKVGLPNFLTLLNLEMKEDLPKYISSYASENIEITDIPSVMSFNRKDSLQHMPYNQGIFDGIVADTTSVAGLEEVRAILLENGKTFFQKPIKENKLDAILSINNYHAAFAAVALHPCLTIPMGYKKSGEPIGITFIASPYSEAKLYELGSAFESLTKSRRIPEGYKD